MYNRHKVASDPTIEKHILNLLPSRVVRPRTVIGFFNIMKTRKCNKCKIEKPLDGFYRDKHNKDGLTSRCKECFKQYHEVNKSRINEYHKKYGKLNPNTEYRKKYREKNKEKLSKQSQNWAKNKYHTDPDFRLKKCIRSRIREYIKYEYNSVSSLEYLGCDFNFYKQYLENQFTPKMNWDNYGKYWEIDHIKPLCKGGSFHYTNTQPLIIFENRSKGGK